MIAKSAIAAILTTGLVSPEKPALALPKPAIIKPENIEFSKHVLLLGMPLTMGMLAPRSATPLAVASSASWNSNNTSSASHSVTLPSGIQAGNLLLMFFIKNNSNTTELTTPSGWTELASCTPNDNDVGRIYGKIASGSEGSTQTVSTGSSRTAAAITYRITGNRNGLSSSELAVSSANIDGVTTTPNPPSLTPSWGAAENLWIAMSFAHDGAWTFVSYPTNYSLGQNISQHGGGSANGLVAAARLLNASSEDPGVFTVSGTARVWNSFTLAVRPL